jgi:hypothetical protein
MHHTLRFMSFFQISILFNYHLAGKTQKRTFLFEKSSFLLCYMDQTVIRSVLLLDLCHTDFSLLRYEPT